MPFSPLRVYKSIGSVHRCACYDTTEIATHLPPVPFSILHIEILKGARKGTEMKLTLV